MCGIAFLYSAEMHENERRERVAAAVKKINHRGPDASGILNLGHATLGHARLSIIDLAGSAQPLKHPGSAAAITYNGEVYNYREVRQRFTGKWNFASSGDTEVVLASLSLSPLGEALSSFEGMWAFAHWNSEKSRLQLSRDRVGKKPLYYVFRKGFFACASELPALKLLDTQAWSEDLHSTADYLRYGYYLPGTTAYSEVKEVLPAHYLTWEPSHCDVVQNRYWSLPADSWEGSKQEAGEAIRAGFTKAVERRMVADVEVGAFLSGGVDSSLVVSTISRSLKKSIKTFTIGFSNDGFDERKYAQQVSVCCDTDHTEAEFHGFDEAMLEKLIFNHVGQPFADISLLPTAMVSEIASNDVKVVLSGDGGDEFFCGYQRYQAQSYMRWYSRLPMAVRKLVRAGVRAIPEPSKHHSKSYIKMAHLFLDVVDSRDSGTPYIAPEIWPHIQCNTLAPFMQHHGHSPPGLPSESTIDDLGQMMRADALVYLPQDILLKLDRASMAYSLEARAPFLDSELIAMAMRLQGNWHRKMGRGKRMLFGAMSRQLPANIWTRKKQGFAVPVGDWFRAELGQKFVELVNEINTPLNNVFLLSLLEQHQSGARDYGLKLWMLYVYLQWRKTES